MDGAWPPIAATFNNRTLDLSSLPRSGEHDTALADWPERIRNDNDTLDVRPVGNSLKVHLQALIARLILSVLGRLGVSHRPVAVETGTTQQTRVGHPSRFRAGKYDVTLGNLRQFTIQLPDPLNRQVIVNRIEVRRQILK